jgi:pyrimidine dimer DNA glycosylase
LRGRTRGYRHHPQLTRFREHPAPISAINYYLRVLAEEAATRNYNFDRSRIGPVRDTSLLGVNRGQLTFELSHLRTKLETRAAADLYRLPETSAIKPHPLFVARNGPVESWERAST